MSASVAMDLRSHLEFVQNNICQVHGEFIILPQESLREVLLEVRFLLFFFSYFIVRD